MYWLVQCNVTSCEWKECTKTEDDAHGFRWMHESQHPGHTVSIMEFGELTERPAGRHA